MERKRKRNDRNKKNPEGNQNNHNEDQDQKNAVKDDKEKKSEEKTTKQEVTSNNNHKRKHKIVFPYGNYRNYYGYRINELDGDPRLKVFERDWFQGKDCLDIGCNSGILTIQIARKFHCKSILGIDIDSDRVSDAYWHLRKFARTENVEKNSTKVARLDIKNEVNGAEHSASASSVEIKDDISFRQENFAQSQRPSGKQYDTILCLSVTKWIHLNWGDDGLITLFSKIWRLLHPGGILVLEPQPWQSYEKNRRVSETTAMNYRTIMFRPESFREILLDKIGFRRVEDITAGLSGSKAGFDRPIFVYHK
ncbi:RNA methyltransferase [Salix suchowensis]|nr:RNA methyltransferase [Salix suchowensis]